MFARFGSSSLRQHCIFSPRPSSVSVPDERGVLRLRRAQLSVAVKFPGSRSVAFAQHTRFVLLVIVRLPQYTIQSLTIFIFL